MDCKLTPIMISSSSSSSGFLTKGSLLQALIHISNGLTSMETIPLIQSKNISNMIRRINLLSSMFEDIQNSATLPASSILCLAELLLVIQRVKLLILWCTDGSSLWGILQTEYVSNQFFVLVKEMGKALDILPLSLLRLSLDGQEQVELLHKQAKRATLFVDPQEIRKRKELVRIMEFNNNKRRRVKGFIDIEKVKEVLSRIGLRSAPDYEEEILKLEAEVHKQAGTGGLIAVSNINNLISLLIFSKSMIFGDNDVVVKDSKQVPEGAVTYLDVSSSSRSLQFPNVPDEFRCPISLDVMEDPVIVSSGHTYDRKSIAQWINSGHHTCPKSGQRLIHMALIPNYALKSLVHRWCQDNNVPLMDSSSSSSTESEILSSSDKSSSDATVDHVSAKATAKAVKITSEYLVGKLAAGSLEIQCQAAYEIRLLAKTGMENCRIIAEAGAIPFLVALLRSNDPRVQENVVTALLNLSIFQNNKVLIMEAGAVDSIISILESGKTIEARENAAAVIYSLSMINNCKLKIGAHPKAIPALVGLLIEATAAGKRDAASALFNLALNNENKVKVVDAGTVQKLIELLMDDRAGITDEALALIALLLGCEEGIEEMRKNRELVPLLVDLLKYGSAKGKEICITILLGLCRRGGEEVAKRLFMIPRSFSSLQSLAAEGSLKARRKADALLRLLERCCSKSHSS